MNFTRRKSSCPHSTYLIVHNVSNSCTQSTCRNILDLRDTGLHRQWHLPKTSWLIIRPLPIYVLVCLRCTAYVGWRQMPRRTDAVVKGTGGISDSSLTFQLQPTCFFFSPNCSRSHITSLTTFQLRSSFHHREEFQFQSIQLLRATAPIEIHYNIPIGYPLHTWKAWISSLRALIVP